MAEPEKIALPSGGWALFRDPKSLTVGQRRPVKAAMQRMFIAANIRAVLEGDASAASLSDADVLIMEEVPRAVIAALLSEWSFTDLPTSVEGLDGLTDERDYDSLIEAADKVKGEMFPNLAPQTAEDIDDPDHPTDGSPA